MSRPCTKLVKFFPSSEEQSVHCYTSSGLEYFITTNKEKHKHTLWKPVQDGYLKISSSDSPYDLYDKIPWND